MVKTDELINCTDFQAKFLHQISLLNKHKITNMSLVQAYDLLSNKFLIQVFQPFFTT